jgi:hypothetical protein
MDDGILDVSLLPAWSPSSVKAALMAALSRSTLLQAGIGYWTIDGGLLGPDLVRSIQDESGFICVDLHPPTEVDALAAMAIQGGHVHVYYEDIPTYTDQGRKEPPCLLHAKMLLFWSKDRTAELWVGSHNWTKRAILGLNVEASLVVRLKDSSALFAAAAEYLSRMKGIAEPFDVAKVDFYKALQRKMTRGLAPVMELEAEDGASASDTTITVFGTDRSDLRRLGTVRREVHVALLDPRSDEQFLYPATILHSGLLSASDASAGGISFSPRRCALRRGRQFAQLQPAGPVDQAVLNTAEYFATVRLGTLNRSLIAEYPPPRTAILEDVSDETSPLLRRLDENARTQLFGRREIRVKRPTVVADEARQRTVAGRRSLPAHPLVSMRVLRPKFT